MSTFSISLSGLKAASDSLSVIGNDLANLNTDGYKNESLNFASIFNQILGTSGNGDPIQNGNGVEVAGTSTDFANGTVESTGVASNMAIQGNGFFVVENSGGSLSYTRDGDFTVNSDGQLCTASGQLVMGYTADDGVVQTDSALSPITVNSVSEIPASATTSFTTTTNLDATSTTGTSYSTSITVYDSLGESHDLTITYANTGTNEWSYNITMPAADTGGTGDPTVVASGTLDFDSSGVLTSPTGSVAGISITGLADGAADMDLTWNLNSSAGTPTITQDASTSETSSTTQNGYASGTLTGYEVESDGTVEGEYSNDKTLALGQVAIASFANNQGLVQTSNNCYTATAASGAAVIGVAGEGGNGTITGGSVEESNVDLSTEFADMIVAQQGYEANAKALTTMDQVAQATIQMIT